MLGYKVDTSKYTESQQRLITALTSQVKLVSEQVIREFPSEHFIYDLTYQKAQKFIFSGQNIVVDLVLPNHSEIALFSLCFRGHSIKTILLYTSLEENLKRCFLRNELSKNDKFEYRDPAWVVKQYFQFYEYKTEDGTKAIEKVNKEGTKTILSKAIDHVQYLYSQHGGETSNYMERMQGIHKLIEKVTTIINCKPDIYVERQAMDTGYLLDNNSADYLELAGFVAYHFCDFPQSII